MEKITAFLFPKGGNNDPKPLMANASTTSTLTDRIYPTALQERIDSGDYYLPTADTACEFDALVRTKRGKLPWRYKWPEHLHDEVLARLLDLNQKRYDAEVLGGKQAEKKGKRKKQSKNTIPGM